MPIAKRTQRRGFPFQAASQRLRSARRTQGKTKTKPRRVRWLELNNASRLLELDQVIPPHGVFDNVDGFGEVPYELRGRDGSRERQTQPRRDSFCETKPRVVNGRIREIVRSVCGRNPFCETKPNNKMDEIRPSQGLSPTERCACEHGDYFEACGIATRFAKRSQPQNGWDSTITRFVRDRTVR
jgi:hypothetical protein